MKFFLELSVTINWSEGLFINIITKKKINYGLWRFLSHQRYASPHKKRWEKNGLSPHGISSSRYPSQTYIVIDWISALLVFYLIFFIHWKCRVYLRSGDIPRDLLSQHPPESFTVRIHLSWNTQIDKIRSPVSATGLYLSFLGTLLPAGFSLFPL